MARIFGGLAEKLGTDRVDLPYESEQIGGQRISLGNFAGYWKKFAVHSQRDNFAFRTLADPRLDPIPGQGPQLGWSAIDRLQLKLVRNAVAFAYHVCPSFYLHCKDNDIDPILSPIESWDDFYKIPPTDSRALGRKAWLNDLPAPLAELYSEESRKLECRITDLDPNMILSLELYTGGTTNKRPGEDYLVLFPNADLRASVQALYMSLLKHAPELGKVANAACSFSKRHIGGWLWRHVLYLGYGITVIDAPDGCSPEHWNGILEQYQPELAAAPPTAIAKAKGLGFEGMLDANVDTLRYALMTSANISDAQLRRMHERGIQLIYTSSGNTRCLPTGCAEWNSRLHGGSVEDMLEAMSTLRLFPLGPTFTMVSGPDGRPAAPGYVGEVDETNVAASYYDRESREYLILPSLKIAVRSRPGNALYVIKLDPNGRAWLVDREIARSRGYDQGNLLLSQKASRGGCSM
ncbi:hypothetical protein JW930_02545 [Candidatus Woesearchaeota archaeon]|nr:hypothetical protein [Candidatus Woesearchaeota archaeon]